MDPHKKGIVPRKVVDQRLNLLFAGDFNDAPLAEKADDDDSSDSNSI